MRRLALGLGQEDVVALTGDAVTQGWVSDVERGKVDLANAGIAKVVALAKALNWTLAELQAATGAQIGIDDSQTHTDLMILIDAPASNHRRGPLVSPALDEAPFDPRTLFHPPARQERIKRPLWPNLAAMIEEKSARYPKLRRVGWQQHLNQTRFSGGQEPDADGWFEMFRALERAGVEPEEWPEE